MHSKYSQLVILLTAILSIASSPTLVATESSPILLWPNGAPGELGNIDAEGIADPRGNKPVTRLINVSAPTLTLFRAAPEIDTGATVIVCPGGAYQILAYDLEGTEVIEWLNSIGVNGVLLKYRVPRREGLEKHTAPLQDAQRAIGMVRHRAKGWGLDPNRIGILGFSAGGHLSAMASNHFKTRTYPRVDGNDDVSNRPDFTVLIYTAYLTHPDDILKLSPDLTVTNETPPCFLVQTQDDGVKVESSIVYYLACKQAKVPVEMHLYPSGGHGYGLRPTEHLVSGWPKRCEEWMKSSGLLD
jgi:acetyl esterase/lipase